MSSESDKETVSEAAASAAAEVASEIYGDALKPGAQELGKAIGTTAKAVNSALAPLRFLIWGFEKAENKIKDYLEEQYEDVDPSEITTPEPNVAVPAINNLRLTAGKEELQELFLRLLSKSMNVYTKTSCHPSFAHVLGELTPDEARIIMYLDKSTTYPMLQLQATSVDGEGKIDLIPIFSDIGEQAECRVPEHTPVYLQNLERLGILRIRHDKWLTKSERYNSLREHEAVQDVKEQIEPQEELGELIIKNRCFEITDYGESFISVVVDEIDFSDLSEM